MLEAALVALHPVDGEVVEHLRGGAFEGRVAGDARQETGIQPAVRSGRLVTFNPNPLFCLLRERQAGRERR